MSETVLILLPVIPAVCVGFALRGLVDTWVELRRLRREGQRLAALKSEATE